MSNRGHLPGYVAGVLTAGETDVCAAGTLAFGSDQVVAVQLDDNDSCLPAMESNRADELFKAFWHAVYDDAG